MIVIATGWRKYMDTDLPLQAAHILLDQAEDHGEQLLVIHGDAPGLDSILRDWCKAQKAAGRHVDQKGYPADWHVWGRRAGNLRNAHMWAMNWHRVDLCLAFPGPANQSPGTANCVEHAHIHNCPVWLVPWSATELPPLPTLSPHHTSST